MKPLIALFIRALREDARAGASIWIRAGLIAALTWAVWMAQMQSRFALGASGLMFLQFVTWVNAIAVTLFGCSWFAGTIAEEKEDQTLGLLRMTELNPLSILLGKAASELVNATLLLAIQFPFVLLAVTMGGVTANQVASIYAGLIAHLFLLANVGTFFSVMCRRPLTAGAATFLGIALLFFWPLLVVLVLSIKDSWGDVASSTWSGLWAFFQEWLGYSLFGRIHVILGTGFTGSFLSAQIWVNLAIGLLFFLLAWWRFDRHSAEGAEDLPKKKAGKIAGRRRHLWRAGKWAVLWKDVHEYGAGRGGMMLRLMVYFGFVGLLWLAFAREFNRRDEVAALFFWVGGALFSVEVFFAIPRMWAAEWKGQTLGSIVGLPTKLSKLIWQKVAAVFVISLPSFALMLLGGLIAADEVVKEFDSALREIWRMKADDLVEAMFGTWAGLMGNLLTFLFLMKIALHLRRGALIVTVIVLPIMFVIVTALSAFIFREGTGVVLSLLFSFLNAYLVISIGQRIRALAAAE